jgi:hypothetical protein
VNLNVKKRMMGNVGTLADSSRKKKKAMKDTETIFTVTFKSVKNMKQATVRQINAHTFAGTGVCIVHADKWRMRISRARTRKGVTEGRVINFVADVGSAKHCTDVKDWEPIPADAVVELR